MSERAAAPDLTVSPARGYALDDISTRHWERFDDHRMFRRRCLTALGRFPARFPLTRRGLELVWRRPGQRKHAPPAARICGCADLDSRAVRRFRAKFAP
jgi:hypothetical protein